MNEKTVDEVEGDDESAKVLETTETNTMEEAPRTKSTAEESETESAAESGGLLTAALVPWSKSDADEETVVVDIYVVTGRHGILRVPESFCRECHMFTRRAELAAEEVDVDVTINVRSWWSQFPWALRHGGYHPPVMVVGGKKLCQGHDVPTSDEVVSAINAAYER